MQKLYPEFYNDVFGPIMQPGSSSHMAAPCRVGYMCNSLLGENVAKILVELDAEGSFAGTFGVMNEDLGMLNGVMGHMPDYANFFEIKPYLRSNNIPFEFKFCEMKESKHINSMKFTLTGTSGKKATLVANSTGGGMIETVRVNDYSFAGKGDTHVLCIFDEEGSLDNKLIAAEAAQCQTVLEAGIGTGQGKSGVMHWFKLEEDAGSNLRQFLKKTKYAILKPVIPVLSNRAKKKQLFDSVTEWRRLAETQDKSMFDIAIDYEIAASGWSRDQVIDYMKNVIGKTMYRRTHALYEEDVKPIVTPFSAHYFTKWENLMNNTKLVTGTIAKSIYYINAAMPDIPGVLNVPGPMGSGGGFIYSVMSAVKDEYGLTDEDMLRGLFVAAGIGAICYTRTGPTGEIIGCTGECGCCSAMAASAVVEMLNGTPEQIETAASMALQGSVGWPCDPIPGGKQIPCFSRILYVASMSIVHAQMALMGADAVLPFHEVIDVADKIGRSLSDDLLCTARGGHCAAPTAKKIMAEFKKWHQQQ
jgi:L-serine dehydratase